MTEVRQTFSAWATHVIRLIKGQPFVEVEWTAGPIPTDTPWFTAAVPGKPNEWGKELVMRYSSGLASRASSTLTAMGVKW